MSKYFVTYKSLSKFPEKSDYRICDAHLRKHGKIIHSVFEHDSQGKLHVHYIFSHKNKNNNLYYQKLSVQGFHHFVVPIYNESSLADYLQKEDSKYFHTHYAFDSELGNPITPDYDYDYIKETLSSLPEGYDIW